MKKIALITGINGQDGSYLSELLLEKGYEVHGIIRRNSVSESQTIRIDHIFDKIILHYGDLLDISSLISIITKCNPDEIYNLGAQSHVRISFDEPIYTSQVTGIGVLNLLESVRLTNPNIKIYQASSSEMFGNSIDGDGYQRETTSMNPVSPYGCSKLFGYNISKNYRKSYGMFVSNGILFNHESPRRGTNFVTNKVCKEAVRIKLGLSNKLELGNLESTRDWGHAKDYVNAMWMILQHDIADDFVCSTGISHSIKDLCKYVFNYLGLDYENYVLQNEKFLRPDELNNLKGDSLKIKNTLGWKFEYTFETMLDEMIEHWLKFYGSEVDPTIIKPKLSICIPTTELIYSDGTSNGVLFLIHLLKTIEKQTFKDYEIIISDHSKSDVIKNECENWKHLNLKYFKNTNGIGSAVINLNFAISKATGEYIKTVLQDDFFHLDDALENIMNNIGEYKWGAIGTYHCNENDIDNLVREHYPSFVNSEKVLSGDNTLSGISAIFFKNDENYLDKDLCFFNDVEFYYRLFKKYGNPLLLKECGMVTRFRAEGLSSTINKDIIEEEKKYVLSKHNILKGSTDINDYPNIIERLNKLNLE